MKRYGKNYELISRKKMLFIIIFTLIVSLTFYIYAGIVIGHFGPSVFLSLITIILLLRGQNFEGYSFAESAFHICYGKFTVKKIIYSRINTIVISNAVYTVHSRNLYGLKVGKNQIINGKKFFMQYGHISIMFSDTNCWRLKPEMTCLDVSSACHEEVVYDYFFCFDSFRELLSHVVPKTYILEDVYLRYQNQFDEIVLKNHKNSDKFFIVSEKINNYLDYKEEEGK